MTRRPRPHSKTSPAARHARDPARAADRPAARADRRLRRRCPARLGQGPSRARTRPPPRGALPDRHRRRAGRDVRQPTVAAAAHEDRPLHRAVRRGCAPVLARQGDVWIREAEAHHQQVLVAFYHSEYTPAADAQRRPVPARRAEIRQAAFPTSASTSPGTRPTAATSGVLASPSAMAAAQYYQALIRVCRGCTVIGLDVLDAQDIGPTLEYIYEFKHEIGRLRTIMPKIWGLHNYSDINRLESWRTARPGPRPRRPGVADRDRRDRAVRRRLSQPAWLRSDALGEGAQVHVRRRRLDSADQAPLHLRLDRRQRPHALRRRPDERPRPAPPRATWSCASSCTRPTATSNQNAVSRTDSLSWALTAAVRIAHRPRSRPHPSQRRLGPAPSAGRC